MAKPLKYDGLLEAKEIYDRYNWESSKYKPMPLHEFRHYIYSKYIKKAAQGFISAAFAGLFLMSILSTIVV